MMKKILGCIVAASICLSILTVQAKGENIILNDAFNERVTNALIEDYQISGGAYAVVGELAKNNKALVLKGRGTQTVLSKPAELSFDNFVISADVGFDGTFINGKFGVRISSSNVPIINFDKNNIKTHDGKIIGALGSKKLTNISIVCNVKAKRYSVYINGACAVDNWNYKKLNTAVGVYMSIDGASIAGDIYLDNVRAYEGGTVLSNIYTAPCNSKKTDYVPLDSDPGDYTYFNSNYCNTRNQRYENVQLYPKTNKIECMRLDYKNKNRKPYIVFEKTTEDDCYMDIQVKKLKYYNSTKRYDHFIASVDLMLEEVGGGVQLFTMKDTTSAAAQQTQFGLAFVNADGSVSANSGAKKIGVVKPGVWFNCKASIDMPSHTAKIYVNGELLAAGVKFNSNIEVLDVFRLSFNQGKGRLYVDNFELTGLEQPYETGIKTSIFPKETGERDYLKDKIAFHSYAGIVYMNGEKRKLEPKPVYTGGELYVPLEAMNKIFQAELLLQDDSVSANGVTVKLENTPKTAAETSMLPVKEIAEKIFGMDVLDDHEGMIILSNDRIYLDLSNERPFYLKPVGNGDSTVIYPTTVEALNSFLFFERPSAEQIKQDFEKKGSAQQHPRLYAAAGDFTRVSEESKTDAQLGEIVKRLIAKADSIVKSNEVLDYTFQDNMRTWNVAHNLTLRMRTLGFAYQITKDQKYADRAWKYFETCATYPDFNTSHVIDTGMYCQAYAVGYDWMYDGFTAEQRAVIENTVMNYGIEPLSSAYYGRLTSTAGGGVQVAGTQPKWTSNYNTVVTGGLMSALLAFSDCAPDGYFDYMEKTLRAIEASMYGYVPDGGWVEGPDYWYYATRYLIYGIGAFESCTGTDYGIYSYQGLNKTVDYMMGLVSLNGRNNYHDADESKEGSWFPYMYFGNRYGRAEWAAYRTYDILENKSDVHEFDALFYVKTDKKELEQMAKLIVTKGTESFGMRESYTSKDSLFLSAHFGTTESYHSHNDTGTFVLDMLGERWAVDLGKEDYNLSGVSSWETYRRRAEGHNTLTVQNTTGFEQSAGMFAPIIKEESKERGSYVIADLSNIYPAFKSYYRGFYLGDDMNSAIIRDEYECEKKTDAYWFMHTRADIQIEGNSVILIQNGKMVRLDFATNAEKASISAMKAEPLPGSPNPAGQKTNSGINKVAIKLSGVGKINITVKVSPVGSAAEKSGIMEQPMSEWSIPDGSLPAKEDYGFQYYFDGELIDNYIIPKIEGMEFSTSFIANDPEKIVETEDQPESRQTIVKVYNKDKTNFRPYIMKYTDSGSAMLKFYDDIEVKTIQVTSEPEYQNSGINAIDGDLTTKWFSPLVDDYAVLDLGSIQSFDTVAVAHWKGNERKYSYEIQVSTDGVNYVTITDYTASGESEDFEFSKFEPQEARYVKFIGKGNNINTYNNPYEIKILKSKAR